MHVSLRAAAAVLLLSALVQAPLAAADAKPASPPGPAGPPARFLPSNYEVAIQVQRPGGQTEHRLVVAGRGFEVTAANVIARGDLVPQADGALVIEYNLSVYESDLTRGPQGRIIGQWRSAARLAAGESQEVIRSGETLVRMLARPLG